MTDLPRYPLAPELDELINGMAESCPDVESGDEEAEDVAECWRDAFQQHAEAAVHIDRLSRGHLSPLETDGGDDIELPDPIV